MNAIIVMSGGSGERFGGAVPKQYVRICGRPVIDYVLDAADGSEKADETVIVMDEKWTGESEKISSGRYPLVPNGKTRVLSLYNGLKFLKERFSCEKVVIVDAVRPLITPELLDGYFDKLDEFDAVITSEKITGGFTDIRDRNLDREEYIITQSPEGFRFGLLWENYDPDFKYQETAGMLPAGSKRYYNFAFRNNLKLTYDFELEYAEMLIRKRNNGSF